MRIKNKIVIIFVVLLTVVTLAGSAVQAVNIDALCFMPIDDVSELKTGDQVRLRNNHTNGPLWLTWDMDVYQPVINVQSTKPLDGEYYNRFTYHNFGGTYMGLYIVSPYEGFKYYMSPTGPASMNLRRLDEIDPEDAKWSMFIGSPDCARLTYQSVNQPFPHVMGLAARPTAPKPYLTIRSVNNNKCWSVDLGHPCTIRYNVTADWGTGYNATITIENNTGHVITDWELVMFYSYPIDSISNAVVKSKDYSRYVIKNAGWNGTIQPASEVTFYISGNVGNLQYDPWNCTVVTK